MRRVVLADNTSVAITANVDPVVMVFRRRGVRRPRHPGVVVGATSRWLAVFALRANLFERGQTPTLSIHKRNQTQNEVSKEGNRIQAHILRRSGTQY